MAESTVSIEFDRQLVAEIRRLRAALEQINQDEFSAAYSDPDALTWEDDYWRVVNIARQALGPAHETTTNPLGARAGLAPVGEALLDVASGSVYVPTADPACDGSGHQEGFQSSAPPREAKGGGVTSNAGTAACGIPAVETSEP